ncbi:hypothetical protein UFOVP415_43 [uncultured Caudovirales phage]|uniref:Uncharacterized protein n=1 Tax=uncultured Caudovirales phage TaxID=2100421 RepID=A0A6J5M8C3_9CAUD|nr:hypothetical protein UFOVP415_43 [uncultured Caudovirales phage]
MNEAQRIQEALNAGYTKEDIRAAYVSKGLPLPKEIDITPEERQGTSLSKGARLAMTAAQGPTLGFADELAGIIQAPFIATPGESMADAYTRGRDVYRAGVESYRQEQPIGSAVAQGVAALPLGMINLGRQALPQVGPVMRSVGAGGLFGAAAGAGEATSLEDIPQEALTSGITSAVLGGGTELGMKAVRPAASIIRAQAGRVIPESVRSLVGGSSTDLARNRVAQAMLRDGATPDQVTARMSKLGDDAILAEAAGYNTRDLLDTMATLPGRTKNYTEDLIRQRQSQRGGRIATAAQQQLSPTGVRLADSVESLITKRDVEATPLYEQLKTVNISLDDDLRQILDASKKLGAFARAEKISTGLREPFSLKDFQKSTSVAMTDLDKVKRGIDDIISSKAATNERGEINEFGRSVVKLKQDLLKRLDDATVDPDTGSSLYKSARNAYAGPSALITAAELGRTVLNKPAATIKTLVKDMSDSELESFRVGAYEGLRDLAGTQSGQTRLLNMWKEPATQERLKEIFPSERAFRQFASNVAAEARKKDIQTVGRGSQTAGREARMEDVGLENLKDTVNLTAAAKTMDVGSLINLLSNSMTRTSLPEPVRNEIGRILMSRATSGDEVRMLRSVIDRMKKEQEAQARTSGIIGSQLAPAAEPFTAALRSLLQ